MMSYSEYLWEEGEDHTIKLADDYLWKFGTSNRHYLANTLKDPSRKHFGAWTWSLGSASSGKKKTMPKAT